MNIKKLEKEIMAHLEEAPIVKEHLKVLDWKVNWVMRLIGATFVATLATLIAAMLRH